MVSHDSALEMLRLSDVIPYAVHITVPRSKRYRGAPQGVALHTAKRPPDPADLVTIDGLPVTSAARTILDVAEAGLDPEQLAVAVSQAAQRSIIDVGVLLESARQRPERVPRLVREALGMDVVR